MNNNKTVNVQSIRNQFEQNVETKPSFILQRSVTSIGQFAQPKKCEKVKSHPVIPRKPTTIPFQRSKTSLDLFDRSNKCKEFQNVGNSSKTQPILSRQLSDPAKRGNIKRTPAFRCEKSFDSGSLPSPPVSNDSSKLNLTNKIRMFEQCQSKNKVPNSPKPIKKPVIKHSSTISSSPTKYKTNQILKEELDLISKRRKQFSKTQPKLILNDSTSSYSSSDSPRSASQSPVPMSVKIIPEYSIVNKRNKKPLAKVSSIENLTDTLKKALKSPLPDGPPPKKPPRTFAHPSPKIPHSIPKISQNEINPQKKPMRARNDPVRMLDKLENALLQNKIKSPRTRRKVLDVENIKSDSSLNRKPMNVAPSSGEHQSRILDCFPICSTNEYAKPLRSQSEFFVDQNILHANKLAETLGHSSALNRKNIEHIYAEPFDFHKNVPDLIKTRNTMGSCWAERNDGNDHLVCDNNFKTFERNLEKTKSSNDLHYMCTPIEASVTATKYNTTNNNCKLAADCNVPDMGCHKNNKNTANNNVTKLSNDFKYVDKLKNVPYDPAIHSSSTDSDFESSASTSDEDHSSVKSSSSCIINQCAHTQNHYLCYSLQESEMAETTNVLSSEVESDNTNTLPQNTERSGRVRALIEKLESIDSGSEMSNSRNVRAKLKHSAFATPIPRDKSDTEIGGGSYLNSLASVSEHTVSTIKEKQNGDKQKKRELTKTMSVKHKKYVRRVSSIIDRYTRLIPQTQCAPHLFDCCLLVGLNMMTKIPYVKSKFPPDATIPQRIETLCFPDASHWDWNHNSKENGGTYSLVFTTENGDRSFGFCRRVLPEGELIFLPLVYCILTKFHTVGFYNNILQEIESRHGLPESIVNPFFQELYATPFPKAGDTVHVKYCKLGVPNNSDEGLGHVDQKAANDSGNFSDTLVDSFALYAQIDSNCNVTNKSSVDNRLESRKSSFSSGNSQCQHNEETNHLSQCEILLKRPQDIRMSEECLAILVNTLPINSLLEVFGSLLLERKVVFVCSTISKLSTCVEALQSLLYPFSWQHTFITVLPSSMIDFLNAPTPYIIGVLSNGFDSSIDIADGIVINIDTGRTIRNVGDESDIVPPRILRQLKTSLQSVEIQNTTNKNVRNVLVSEAFIETFLQLIGKYRQFIQFQNCKLAFSKAAFIRAYPSKTNQLFLEWFTETAMFNAFIDSQINPNPTAGLLLNQDDIFAQRVLQFVERNKRKKSLGEKLKNLLG